MMTTMITTTIPIITTLAMTSMTMTITAVATT